MKSVEITELKNEKKVELTYLNIRAIQVISNMTPIITENNKKITKIHFNEEYIIEKNSYIEIQQTKYKIEKIESTKLVGQKGKWGFILITNKLTFTSIFALPMISDFRHTLQWYDTPSDLFINAYIGIQDSNIQENIIYLRYKFDSKWDQEIKKLPYYISHLDLDTESVFYIFSIPPEHQEDYRLFKEGKYSKLSRKLQNKIMAFHQFQVGDEIDLIMRRHPRRIERLEKELNMTLPNDVELMSKPNLNIEAWKSTNV